MTTNQEAIKENMRVLEWGLYSPDGKLFGAFRYEQDALACVRGDMAVRPLKIEAVMHTCKDVKLYSDEFDAVYITLLATVKTGDLHD